jgi:predicted DNA-binding transcriptional regulator
MTVARPIIPRQVAILLQLHRRPMTAREIATKLDMTYSSAATLLSSYAVRGLVVRGEREKGLIRWSLPAPVPPPDRIERDPDQPPPLVRAW